MLPLPKLAHIPSTVGLLEYNFHSGTERGKHRPVGNYMKERVFQNI